MRGALTCFSCGRALDPDDFYVPFQGWMPPDTDDPDDIIDVQRANDCRFCPECVWEIETGTSAVVPSTPPDPESDSPDGGPD